jgi:hypothetical protein
VPRLHAVHTLLASVRPKSGSRKVPPERLARSLGMTSHHESASIQLQNESLLTVGRIAPRGLKQRRHCRLQYLAESVARKRIQHEKPGRQFVSCQ